MINNTETWKNYYRSQERPDWCGVSTIQMALLAGNIEKGQNEIAEYVYKSWFGTPSILLLAYLSKFFKIVNYKTGATFRDISFHLKKNHVVIVNWWDDLDSDDSSDGHYSIVGNYKGHERLLTIVDPSPHRGIWDIRTEEFNTRWYDTIAFNGLYVTGWMAWVDLESRIL